MARTKRTGRGIGNKAPRYFYQQFINQQQHLAKQNEECQQQQQQDPNPKQENNKEVEEEGTPKYAIDCLKNSNMPEVEKYQQQQPLKYQQKKEQTAKKREKKAARKASKKKAKEYKPKPKKSGKKKKDSGKKVLRGIEPIFDFDGPEAVKKIRHCLSNSKIKKPSLIFEDQANTEKILKGKKWAILENQPTFASNQDQKWDEIRLQIERIDTKNQYIIKPSAIFNFVSAEDKIILSSYVHTKFPSLIDPPYVVTRYNTASGAGPICGNATYIDKHATVGTGFYTYQQNAKKIMTYSPEDIFSRPWFFWGSQQQDFKDCLVHAVNFALRSPYFQCREQIINLMAKRMKKNPDKACSYKSRGGVPFRAFTKFAIVEDSCLSLVPICTITRAKKGRNNDFELFQSIIENKDWNELIITAIEINCGNHTNHSFTLIKVPKVNFESEVLILDSRMAQRQYLDKKYGQQEWNLQQFLQNTYSATIYKLERIQLKEKEKQLLQAELKGFMTGDMREYEVLQYNERKQRLIKGNKGRKKKYV